MDSDVLDMEAAVDDAAWDRRMAEALRPPPEVDQCPACGRWAVVGPGCCECGWLVGQEVTP